MLQHQVPVRRWKQWLALPVLGALSFVTGHAASAQAGPTGRAQITPMLSEAQLNERKALTHRKVREAEHQDSLLTGGKVEPGMTKQYNIAYPEGKGEPVVTITRIKIPTFRNNELLSPRGSKVYTYVQQMPQLPGGGSMPAVVQAIQSRIVYSKSAVSASTTGMVIAAFIVEADGTVASPRIIKSLTDELDEAVLAAIRQLPRFEPGKQDGQAVAVSFTVPVKFVPKP